jgi:hypothetical protein
MPQYRHDVSRLPEACAFVGLGRALGTLCWEIEDYL